MRRRDDFKIAYISRDSFEKPYSRESLLRQMTQLSFSNQYGQSQKQYNDFLEKVFHPCSDDVFNITFLLSKDSQLFGFLNASVVYESIDIDYIYVKESEQGKGLGSKLLSAFLEYFTHFDEKGLSKKIFLEVSFQNKSAISFYKIHGFQKISMRKNYYKNSEDAILMEKKI